MAIAVQIHVTYIRAIAPMASHMHTTITNKMHQVWPQKNMIVVPIIAYLTTHTKFTKPQYMYMYM